MRSLLIASGIALTTLPMAAGAQSATRDNTTTIQHDSEAEIGRAHV